MFIERRFDATKINKRLYSLSPSKYFASLMYYTHAFKKLVHFIFFQCYSKGQARDQSFHSVRKKGNVTECCFNKERRDYLLKPFRVRHCDRLTPVCLLSVYTSQRSQCSFALCCVADSPAALAQAATLHILQRKNYI